MSHFTVMVIGDNPEKQLAPFHEFECTGNDDEYVKDYDVTAETRKEYNKDTTDRLKDPKGKLYSPYDDQFYRDPTPAEIEKIGKFAGTGSGHGMSWTSKDWGDGKGYRTKVSCIPKGWKRVTVPVSKAMTFREFVEEYRGTKIVPFYEKPDLKEKHKYGYAQLDRNGRVLKIIDRTNKNSKWDWYQLGGRWSGFFKLKDAKPLGDGLTAAAVTRLALTFKVHENEVKKIAEFIKAGDRDGLFQHTMANPISGGFYLEKEITELLTPRYLNGRTGSNHGEKPAESGKVDQALKRDIDFDGMRDEAGTKAADRYDRLTALFGGKIPTMTLIWEDMIKGKGDIEKKRKEYWAQPALKKLEAIRNRKDLSEKDKDLVSWLDLSDYQISRDAYIAEARGRAISTFAVVKDSKWYEKGKMGWWACVSGEKKQSDWDREIGKLLDSVSDDTMLTMVDCHI